MESTRAETPRRIVKPGGQVAAFVAPRGIRRDVPFDFARGWKKTV